MLHRDAHVFSPVLYTLFTHHSSLSYPPNSIIQLADNTTVLGLISNNDESAYRSEVQELAVCGSVTVTTWL